MSDDAIGFGEGAVHVVRNWRGRVRFTRTAWKGGFFQNLLLVGSDLVERKVEDVVDLKPEGGFFGWNLLRERKLTGLLVLSSEERRVSLQSLKGSLTSCIRSEPFWDDSGLVAAMTRRVGEAKSFPEVLSALEGLSDSTL